MPQTPKALIFDLGGVIVPLDFGRAYSRMAELAGCEAAEVPPRIRATGLVPLFETGQVEPSDFVDQLSTALNVSLSYDQFAELWSSIFVPGPLLSEAFFRSLRERYRLILLSNTNSLHFDLLARQYPLLELFHEKVLSFQVGALKPAPLVYREAIARAGVGAGECFFTDDILTYVEAARAEGIDAVQFTTRENLELELLQRGVVWNSGL